MPGLLVTLIGYIRFGCKISPKAEVELTPLLSIGKGCQISSFTKIKSADGLLSIGYKTDIGTSCFISSDIGGVYIGDHCLIGPNVTIVGNNYKYDMLDVPFSLQGKTSKGIKIGDNVWLGAGVSILDGAIIGNGVIVTPNSVVSGKVAENSVVQGNPAKVIFVRR